MRKSVGTWQTVLAILLIVSLPTVFMFKGLIMNTGIKVVKMKGGHVGLEVPGVKGLVATGLPSEILLWGVASQIVCKPAKARNDKAAVDAQAVVSGGSVGELPNALVFFGVLSEIICKPMKARQERQGKSDRLYENGNGPIGESYGQANGTIPPLFSAPDGNATSNYTAPGADNTTSTIPANLSLSTSTIVTSTAPTSTTMIQTFNTTFLESGLPEGTVWAATFYGTEKYSASQYANFTTVAGNYSFNVSDVYIKSTNETYVPSIDAGTTPAGSEVAITFSFLSPPTSTTVSTTTTQEAETNTTFTASGLPPGAIWEVNYAGTGKYSGTASINFTTQAGNYTFPFYVSNVTVGAQNATYVPEVRSGDLQAGGDLDVLFEFLSQSTTTSTSTTTTLQGSLNTTFTENGLPGGTLWGAQFAGIRKYSTGAEINFTTISGNYSFSVANVYVSSTNMTYAPFVLVGTSPAGSTVDIGFTVSVRNLTNRSSPGAGQQTFNMRVVGGVASASVRLNSSNADFRMSGYVLNHISASFSSGISSLNISVSGTHFPLPSTAPMFLPAYEYIHINESTSNATTGRQQDADGYVSNVTYNFSVPNSWIDQQGGTGSVVLFKYGNGWNPLPTEQTGANSTSRFYTATSDSFSNYAIGYVSGAKTSTTDNLILTLPSGEHTYFFTFAGMANSKTGTTAITNSFNLSVSNIIVDQMNERTTAPTFINMIAIGYNTVFANGIGARTGNLVFNDKDTTPTYNIIIAGLGANVIMANNAVFASNKIEEGGTDVMTYTVPPADSNAVTLLFFGAGGAVFNTIAAPILPAGCTEVSATSIASNAEAEVANCIQAPGSYTLSFNTLPKAKESLAEIALVFPPYYVTFNDIPSTGNIIEGGTTLASGGTDNIIGTGAITSVAPVSGNYVFNALVASSARGNYIVSPGNFIISSPTSTSAFITVMGNGIVTATWNALTMTDLISNGLVDGGQLETAAATVTNNNGIEPFTYNYMVYAPNGEVVDNALYNNVYSESNTFTFVQAPGWGAGAFMVNVILTDAGGEPSTAQTSFNGLAYGANSPFDSAAWTASNSLIDANQIQVLTASVAGGTETNSTSTGYTYNFLVYGPTGALVDNALFIGQPSVTNTFTFAQSSMWGAGAFTANIIVNDSATTPNTVVNSLTYGAGALFFSNSLTVEVNPITPGQIQTIFTSVGGGTPNFNYNILVYGPEGLVTGFNSPFTSSATNTITYTQDSAWGTGVFTVNVVYTDSASSVANVITNSTSYTAMALDMCTIVTNAGSIGFGDLAPLGSTATSNLIVDTNTGTSAANIMVYGSNWVSGGYSFLATNTLWNPSSAAAGTGNAVTLGNPIPTDTGIYLPANTGSAYSNDIYFGLYSIPPAQPAGAYTQNIVVENYC